MDHTHDGQSNGKWSPHTTSMPTASSITPTAENSMMLTLRVVVISVQNFMLSPLHFINAAHTNTAPQ